MPTFFVPFASSEDIAEDTYEKIRRFVRAPLTNGPRVYAVAWKHNGRSMTCRVGEAMPQYFELGSEPVIAIFEDDSCYKICTPNRGVARWDPVLAGKGFETEATYFSPDMAGSE